jgi:Asp-tRNA(Asn)/Glu-tRNA(Gln) amidotransferase A subunit family amidase
MRCGVTGLRPTFGRVPRTGAMTLCWSLDKLGPMTRSVEDAMLVLQAITGPDAGDVSSVPSHLEFDATASANGLRAGYFAAWMKENPATDVDRAALETVKKLGMVPTEVSLPDWPYGSLQHVLFSEAAAAFEELTLGGGLSTMKVQVPDAWPNLFREARFLSAVDFVQADRFRRRVATEMARVFSQVDVLLVPSLRDEMLTLSNFTGTSVAHPSRRFRQRLRSAQRLGARREEPVAEILASTARATRRDVARPIVRRRHGRAGGARAGAGIRRRGRATAGVLRALRT